MKELRFINVLAILRGGNEHGNNAVKCLSVTPHQSKEIHNLYTDRYI